MQVFLPFDWFHLCSWQWVKSLFSGLHQDDSVLLYGRCSWRWACWERGRLETFCSHRPLASVLNKGLFSWNTRQPLEEGDCRPLCCFRSVISQVLHSTARLNTERQEAQSVREDAVQAVYWGVCTLRRTGEACSANMSKWLEAAVVGSGSASRCSWRGQDDLDGIQGFLGKRPQSLLHFLCRWQSR